ncbi:MAG TPA: hypothetical protein VMV45_21765 [Casimicrobiaceae bacterium]|nr:hypothetical protein [Casimicrobiaceae bacterium]
MLLQRYKCSICHDETQAKAGPAYAEIARHYRGRSYGRRNVLRVIKQGEHGGGPWNMPPHPEIPDREARVMAQYILAVHE